MLLFAWLIIRNENITQSVLNTAAPKAIPQKPNAESKFLRNQSIKVTELGQ